MAKKNKQELVEEKPSEEKEKKSDEISSSPDLSNLNNDDE